MPEVRQAPRASRHWRLCATPTAAACSDAHDETYDLPLLFSAQAAFTLAVAGDTARRSHSLSGECPCRCDSKLRICSPPVRSHLELSVL